MLEMRWKWLTLMLEAFTFANATQLELVKQALNRLKPKPLN